MQIDYAKVSTKDQDLSLQYEALNLVNCNKIYEDKATVLICDQIFSNF